MCEVYEIMYCTVHLYSVCVKSVCICIARVYSVKCMCRSTVILSIEHINLNSLSVCHSVYN